MAITSNLMIDSIIFLIVLGISVRLYTQSYDDKLNIGHYSASILITDYLASFIIILNYLFLLITNNELFPMEFLVIFNLIIVYPLNSMLWIILLQKLFYPHRNNIKLVILILLVIIGTFMFTSFVFNPDSIVIILGQIAFSYSFFSTVYILFLFILNLVAQIILAKKLRKTGIAMNKKKSNYLIGYILIYIFYEQIIFTFIQTIVTTMIINSIFSILGIFFYYKTFSKGFLLPKSVKEGSIEKEYSEDLYSLQTEVPESSRGTERNVIQKLKKIIKVSDKVRLDMMQKSLGLSEDEFLEKLFDWADEYDLIVDGDYLVINKETMDNFIDALDDQFAKWEKKEEEGRGKI